MKVAWVLTCLAVFSPAIHADSILLAAPSAGGFYYGMYCVSCVGVEFTLAGSYDVSTIDVELRTPVAPPVTSVRGFSSLAVTGFDTFDFSLLSSSAKTIFTATLMAPLGGENTEVMNVNETLPAGTYYLVGNVPNYLGTPITPGNVDGWVLSTGTYNDTAGSVINGVGSFVGTSWIEDTTAGHTAPAFTVNGSPSTPTPEPSAPVMVFLGLLVIFGAAARLDFLHSVCFKVCGSAQTR